MDIIYTDKREYTAAQLQALFHSVAWRSADYPDRLRKALEHCETVYTAWHEGRLVGLINAIDDSELTAYVHYLCVDPGYQGMGIGKELLRRVKEKYKDYLYIILIAENEPLIKYYRDNGFKLIDGQYIMELLNP
ncbi:MAG: GNAT family N-acetyltransferase [Acetatifactor sp.]